MPGSVFENIYGIRQISLAVKFRKSSFNLQNIVALKRSDSVTVFDSLKNDDHCSQLKLESCDLF